MLRADLEQAKPDVLIVVANDQFVNFFCNNVPTFFVTLAERGQRPVYPAQVPIPQSQGVGRATMRAGMERGIDFSFGEHIELQHTQSGSALFSFARKQRFRFCRFT